MRINNYNSNDNTGCLLVIIFVAFCLFLGFIGDLIITKIIIWVADGLFNCDWSDKFWQVFWGLIVASLIFNIHIKIGKD